MPEVKYLKKVKITFYDQCMHGETIDKYSLIFENNVTLTQLEELIHAFQNRKDEISCIFPFSYNSKDEEKRVLWLDLRDVKFIVY